MQTGLCIENNTIVTPYLLVIKRQELIMIYFHHNGIIYHCFIYCLLDPDIILMFYFFSVCPGIIHIYNQSKLF
mgnify:CR=1 FL=1